MRLERQTPRRGSRRIFIAAAAAALFAVATGERPLAQNTPQVAIDVNDIGGVVTGANGPEAGVWVIAETRELGTMFRKIVVTDARGRYVLPDQQNGLGLGRDTAIINGTNSDSLMALNRATGEFLVLRVPYPLGFYTRGMDVRIDDPNGGWKGRAMWATNGTRSVWNSELGPGDRGRVFKLQMRPDPLAK